MPGVSIEPAKTVDEDGWNATTLHLYSHCGTHMDAPLHFGVSERTIDEIPLESLMGPAWVVDLSGASSRAPSSRSATSPARCRTWKPGTACCYAPTGAGAGAIRPIATPCRASVSIWPGGAWIGACVSSGSSRRPWPTFTISRN